MRFGWLFLVLGVFVWVLNAQDAGHGAALYGQQCASCHGDKLQGRNGPPLLGGDFGSRWPTSELTQKIQKTMPQDKPGKLTAGDAADLTAYIQQTGRAAGVTATGASPNGPVGNLNQLMRGVMFPNSNIIFTVQTNDPAQKPKAGTSATADGGFNWSMWGSDLYPGWEIVDYAGIALADTAQLLLVPGRRCENGKPVPVDDPDWIKYTKELAEAGKASYRASQTRDQEKVSDVSSVVADACLHCHQVYRDKFRRRGGDAANLSNQEQRCTK
jgi:cytochrome c553